MKIGYHKDQAHVMGHTSFAGSKPKPFFVFEHTLAIRSSVFFPSQVHVLLTGFLVPLAVLVRKRNLADLFSVASSIIKVLFLHVEKQTPFAEE